MNRRELILALAVAGLIVFFAVDRLVIAPLTEGYAAMNEQADQLQSDLTEAQVMVRSADKIEKRWRDYRKAGLASAIDAARIRVQVQVSAWSAETGLQVSTLSSGRVVPGDTYDRMTFALTGSGSLQQIRDFLYDLQSANFPLRVTDCTITRRSDESDTLSVTLQLSTIVQQTQSQSSGLASADRGQTS